MLYSMNILLTRAALGKHSLFCFDPCFIREYTNVFSYFKTRTYWLESIKEQIYATLHSPSSCKENLFTKLNPLSNRPISCSAATTYCVAVMPLDEWSAGDSTSCAVRTACLSRALQLFDVCECLPCLDPYCSPRVEAAKYVRG